jgi:hypothetical protein
MTTPQAFIAISIVVLVVVAVLVFLMGRNRSANRLSPAASLAFSCIVAGIVFGESRLIGYGLMGIGVIFALVDIVNRSRAK